jgi:hypothetical protein
MAHLSKGVGKQNGMGMGGENKKAWRPLDV